MDRVYTDAGVRALSTTNVEDVDLAPKKDDNKDTKAERESLKRILQLARPESKLIAASMGTLVVTSAISLVFPAAIGKILDISLSDGSGMSPTYFAGGLTALFLIQGGFIVARSAMLSVAGERLIARFRKQLFQAVLSQDLSFFDQRRTGELMNRLSADTQLVQKAVTGNLVQGLRNVFMAAGGTAMLFYTSPVLALVSLSIIPPVGFAARRFGRYMKKRQAKVQDALAETSSVAEEVISNIRTVRQFAGEPMEIAKYNTRIDSVYRKASEVGLSTAWYEAGVHLGANFSLVSVLALGGSLVLSKDITAGALTSFLMYSIYVGFNITNLSTVYSDLMKAAGASGRIFEIIDNVPSMPSSVTSAVNGTAGASINPTLLPATMLGAIHGEKDDSRVKPIGASMFGIDRRDGEMLGISPYGTVVSDQSGFNQLADNVAGKLLTPPIDGDVEFNNVTFGYPLRPDPPILSGLNLKLDKGTSLALVGGSGSGKSTIGFLLMRLYDPINGSVRIDGMDITSIDPHWLRSRIGVVMQEPVLFSGTIEDNIRYGNLEAHKDQVNEAAKVANALDFIENFPEGMATPVGERGITLSGGQKQRVAIARAMLKNPPIVLLDEATSALDAESEYQVQLAVEKILEGRTVISIAHRLSTMRAANQIAVLEGGKIVQQGTFDQLMQEESSFQQLIRRQL